MELVDTLKKDGIDKGLCRMWQMKFRKGMDTKALIEMYIKGIDFCIAEDYPTLDFIRDNFKGICEPYGAYVDDEIDLENTPDIVLNGDCKAMLRYNGFHVSRIYARHNSQIAVNAEDNSLVTIDAFDSANLVVATAGDKAQVIVNIYGDAQVNCIGSGIQVHNKNKKSY